jgi:serine/threonine-protein kinase RsbT
MSSTAIKIADDSGIAFALQEARKRSQEVGFEQIQASMIATIVSELATNILKYAGRGQLYIDAVKEDGKRGLRISALDRGPGIENLEESLRDHFSSSGTLGLGLPGVRRMVDEFNISSAKGKGTRVDVEIWVW